MTPSRIIKRSLSIAGHSTSISLEEAFWQDLKVAAARRKQSLAALVSEIDGTRAGANLSSAIRLFVLAEAKAAAALHATPSKAVDRAAED